MWLAVDRAGAHLDPSSADLLHTLGNKLCDVWTEPDCGIWELIDALVRSGHAREARKLWRELTSRVSEQRVDDGLEQADDLSTG